MSEVGLIVLTFIIGVPAMALIHVLLTWLFEGNHKWVNKDGWYSNNDHND